MRVFFILLGMLLNIFLYLVPYYIAYLIILPSSFLGIVGVFILGSIIIPLSMMVLSCLGISISHLLMRKSQRPLHITIEHQEDNTNNKLGKAQIFLIILTIIFGILFLGFLCRDKIFAKQEEVKTTSEVKTNVEMGESFKEPDLSISHPSSVFEVKDDTDLMRLAVNNVLSSVKSQGMINTVKEVRNCYIKATNNKLYCVYFDSAARILDIYASKIFHIPRNEYLYDERVQQRASKYFYQPNHITNDQEHFIALSNELMQLMSTPAINKTEQIDEPIDKDVDPMQIPTQVKTSDTMASELMHDDQDLYN